MIMILEWKHESLFVPLETTGLQIRVQEYLVGIEDSHTTWGVNQEAEVHGPWPNDQ